MKGLWEAGWETGKEPRNWRREQFLVKTPSQPDLEETRVSILPQHFSHLEPKVLGILISISPCPPFLHQPHTSNHRMLAAFEGPWIATEQGQFSEKVDHWVSLASRVFGTWELDTTQRGSTRKEGNKKLPHVVPALCQQQKL